MIVYMSNVHAVIYIAWHCQHFYLHYTAVFRNRSVIIPNDFMLSIVFLIQLPNGVTQSQATYQDRFGKLQEHLRQLTLLFKKLRLLYERCVEMTSDLKEGPAEVREDLCWPPPKKEKQTNIFSITTI